MAGPVRIAILANGSQARREIASTSSFASRSLRSLGGKAKIGAGVGLTALAGGVLAIGKSSIDVERQFSQSMNLIGATTDAPAKKLKSLNDLAIKLGADTSFSANEAADAMLELAKAGLSPATIQAGALEGTLTLAAAGGTDLATAATVASNALNTFGLKGKDVNSVAAALAGGANASSASVESLAQGLQQVGPGATNAGLSLNETVAALSAFDAAGIKGSDAGTSLKTMLTNLVPATAAADLKMQELGINFVKADGSFKSLTQVAQILQDRLGGLSQEQRTYALRTIFGSDATRAATVLAKEGAKGIRGYIEATEDQNAAQKAAQARMAGTEGALERLSGASETARLKIGQALAPSVVKVADALGDQLVPATDAAIRAGKGISRAYRADGLDGVIDKIDDLVGAQGRLSPILDEGKDAAEGLFRIVKELGPAFLDAGDGLGGLLSPLRLAGDVLNVAADVLEVIPDDMLALGVQAGLASLALPRLTSAISTGTAAINTQVTSLRVLKLEMQDTAARSRLLSTGIGKLGGAAKSAAGIGGLLALAKGAENADSEVGPLLTTIGGAATGFSVGGPWGALIGGAAGAALGVFSRKSELAAQAAEKAKQPFADFAASLDEVTGSATNATRAIALKALQDQGAIQAGSALGLSSRTLVDALIGQDKAQRLVSESVKGIGTQLSPVYDKYGTYRGVVQRLTPEAKILAESINTGTEEFKQQQRQVRADALAVKSYKDLLPSIPKKKLTQIKAEGAVESALDVANLAKKYKLPPKEIRTLIGLKGVDASVGQVKRLVEALDGAKKTKVDLSPAVRDTTNQIGRMKQQAALGASAISKSLGDGTKKAKADLGPFRVSIVQGMGPARTAASIGATSIGANLKSGVISGVAGLGGALSAIMSSAVAQALAAARARAKIKSPSRETDYIGRMLGKGLTGGLKREQPNAKKGGRDLVSAALLGVRNGSDGVEKALDRVGSLVERSFESRLKATEKKLRNTLKGEKLSKALRAAESRNEKASRAAIKSLRDEEAALKKNGRAQDAVARKLDSRTQKLKEAQKAYRDYSNTIKQSVVDYGTVVGLGTIGDSTAVTSDRIISQLEARVKAATQYSRLIRSLQREGLNRTTVQQLLDAGVEGGLGTAQAIAAGGDGAIKQINSLTGQLTNTGGKLGEAMAKQYKRAGVQAAQGMVDGLKSKERQLDKAADRLGRQLAAAVKRSLGIKSPSRVFRDIGDNTVKGLALGLDETYVKQQGARIAAALELGYARPDLAARAAVASTSTGSGSTYLGRVDLRLSTAQVSAMQRGREVQADLDVYHGAGGKAVRR